MTLPTRPTTTLDVDDAVHTVELDGLGTLTAVPVVPDRDADLLHAWVTEDRARFWMMQDRTRDEVREIYTYLDGLATHHAYLALLDGVPVALLQTYQPEHDPVGECYEVQDGDFGAHFLLAPATDQVPGFTLAVVLGLGGFLFADPTVQRLVAEPDAGNAKALARITALGFDLGPVVQMPEKTAQLAFLPRSTYESLLAAHR